MIGVDLSARMLAEARKPVARQGWSNVELIEGNAVTAEIEGEVEAVLFSLAYSAIPPEARVSAAERAWGHLRPGGRLAIMGLGLTRTRLRPLLAPIAKHRHQAVVAIVHLSRL